MKPKYIYSGNCCNGKVGEPTELKDIQDKELKIGDIVIVAKSDGKDSSFHGLSVVCGGESHNVYGVDNKPYVMGIAGVNLADFDSEKGGWYVIKVKDCEDVVENEAWREYGFNYRSE